MKGPDRLTDTGSDDYGAALLRSAKGYRVSDETRQRALATLGLAPSAGIAATKSLPKAGFSSAKLALWAVSGALVLVSGSLFVASGRGPVRPAVKPSAAGVSVARLPQTADSLALPSAGLALAPNRESASASPSSASASPSNASASPLSPAASSPGHASSDLTIELAALDAAAKAIQAGNGAGALPLLDAYSRAFPHGTLNLEAKVLRVEALQSAGRHDEAVARARAFVARYPTSPLAEHMHRIAGD